MTRLTERYSRRRATATVLVGIILLTIPCYLLGFGLLWIAQPVATTDDGRQTTVVPTAVPTTDDGRRTIVPTTDDGRRTTVVPTAAVPPTAVPTAEPSSTATPEPTATDLPPTEPPPPTETATEVVVVPLETATPELLPIEPTMTPAP
jgi:hypothetical protein